MKPRHDFCRNGVKLSHFFITPFSHNSSVGVKTNIQIYIKNLTYLVSSYKNSSYSVLTPLGCTNCEMSDLVSNIFFTVIQTGQKLRGALIKIHVRVTCVNMCRWHFVLAYKIEEIQLNAVIP